MKIDRLLLLSFLVFSTINIDAQDYVDLAKFHYASTPLNQFDSIGGDSDIREYGLDVHWDMKSFLNYYR